MVGGYWEDAYPRLPSRDIAFSDGDVNIVVGFC